MRTLLMVLFVVALAGCGPPTAKCTASSCSGCCDSTGQCQIGGSNGACGTGAASCQSCANSQACTFGQCVTQNTSGGGGGTGGGGAGGGTGSGGGTGGGGTGGGGTGGGTFGRIYVADYHFSDAGFVGAAAFFSSAGRTRATIGPCEIVTYADVAAAIGTSSAGDISIAISGRSSPIPLARPQDGGIPSYFTYNEHIFNGGETVTVTATGADVPAFATTLTAPTRPTLTAVGIAANGVIDRSQAITVRWTGGSPQLSVSLSGTTDAGLRVVECRFDAAAGSGTILPTVLQQLPSGLAGSFGIAAITSKPLNAGSWSFDVDAIDYLAVSSITMQ